MTKTFENIRNIEASKSRKNKKYELLRPDISPKKPNQLLKIPTRPISYLLDI